MSQTLGGDPSQRCRVFRIDSVPFQEVAWGRTKVLIGRDAEDTERGNDRVLVKVTENSAGSAGVHELHSHSDQDEILVILDGEGENVSGDGTVQGFGPGDVVYIRAGCLHEDRSVRGTVRFLVIKVPPD